MKRNLLSIVAVLSTGNGSCFFNPASILKVGDESASDVLRALTAAELYIECRKLCGHECLTLSAHLMRRSKGILFADMLSIENGQNEWYQTNDQISAILREAINIAKPRAHVPLLAFVGLAIVLQEPIYSVHPDKPFNCRQLLHQGVSPFENQNSESEMHTMWSKVEKGPSGLFIPNHFVPLFRQ